MAGIARRNDFPWDAIFGAEIAGDYKPKPRVYLRAAEAFDCEPAECVMVAAHSGDLAAAAEDGPEDRACRAPERARPRQGRAETDRAGRYRGREFHGTGRQARRVIPKKPVPDFDPETNPVFEGRKETMPSWLVNMTQHAGLG